MFILISNQTGRRDDGLNFGPEKTQTLLVIASQERKRIKATVSVIWRWKWDHCLSSTPIRSTFNATMTKLRQSSTYFFIKKSKSQPIQHHHGVLAQGRTTGWEKRWGWFKRSWGGRRRGSRGGRRWGKRASFEGKHDFKCNHFITQKEIKEELQLAIS